MPRSGSSRMLPIARRVLAAFFALTWLVLPGFGLIDLSVTWDPTWPQVLEAGWGLYMTSFVGVPFVAVAARTSLAVPAALQLYVAAAALIVSAVAALEWPLLLLGLVLIAETVIVTGLPSPKRMSASIRPRWQPLLVLVGLAAIPAVVYALIMWDLNRQDRFDADITIGIDHYAVQGAYALTSVALVTVAALWAPGRLLLGCCAGLSAVYFGLVSWAWHPTPGSVSSAWSAAWMLWGAAVVVVSIVTRPVGRRRAEPRPSVSGG